MIKVGAPTPPERKELLDRVDDAVKAVMSAKRGGVVKGGGNALAQLGIPYLTLPISVQLTNSGIKETESNELNEKSYLDPTTGTIKDDFLEDGIVDPLNVVVAAVKTAFSTVSLLLDSSVMLVDETPDK
jgi:chaperonin GroEL (HSP60 family)